MKKFWVSNRIYINSLIWATGAAYHCRPGLHGNALRDELEERRATAVIPPRANRVDEIDYDREIYKACPRESRGGVIW